MTHHQLLPYISLAVAVAVAGFVLISFRKLQRTMEDARIRKTNRREEYWKSESSHVATTRTDCVESRIT